MTEFAAVGYEWRAIPGADDASVELEVIGEIEGLFVWAAAQPAAVDRPATARVFRRGMPPQISVGAGKLWVKASGDRNCYIDYDILAGGAGGVDIIARTQSQTVTGEPGEDVPTGETRSIIGRDWYNPTATAVTVPGTPTVANLAALGLIEDVPNASTELYDTVQTAADVTHTALARGVKVFSNAGARIARLPTGIAVGQERRFIRNGPGNVDIFIADGATEIIYTRNATTGALENAADGGVRLNFDEGWVLIKKISATAWEVYDRGHSGAGATGAVAPPPPAAPGSGYTHVQAVAATVWTVNHNLGYFPIFQAYDENGDDLGSPDFRHVSVNQTTITYAAATAGGARFI